MPPLGPRQVCWRPAAELGGTALLCIAGMLLRWRGLLEMSFPYFKERYVMVGCLTSWPFPQKPSQRLLVLGILPSRPSCDLPVAIVGVEASRANTRVSHIALEGMGRLYVRLLAREGDLDLLPSEKSGHSTASLR